MRSYLAYECKYLSKAEFDWDSSLFECVHMASKEILRRGPGKAEE